MRIVLLFAFTHFATCVNNLFAFSAVVRSTHPYSSSELRMSLNYDDVRVMVNGMPGPMAVASAEACLRKGLGISPVAMTGPNIEPQTITVTDSVTGKSSDVRLIPADNKEEIESAIEGLKAGVEDVNNLLVIDFTHPSAVNSNAIFYAENKIPFVMGTTGGDREQLVKDMQDAKAFAVIAPNMGKQIVALQAGLEDLAKKFPSAFSGYKMHVKESHQKTKADTSGTAKAIVESLTELSDDDFSVEDIEMIRDEEESMAFGVPEESMNGHAFHTYTFTSPDSSVQFQLQHNVVGRTVYAEGTADAVKFLAGKIREETEGKIYNMIDVLEAGALE
eukprot:CAMPEP_0197832878 /NCGR_PEP_ID=MMETSP1437-20131217/16612_1 /TAXON_ID=49252 ORGANISM="Eucampia antarctica, Strain CCMP1452" /NCGR_SAMPLE_ID=MMETSP1437 /ASSEMBLY_ACC=CAM_ASM_001096 /LENGTH=332 /DNA_ID=CAMNT_0043436507 /DNA_START=48 /DNA_END=1046 /DNA_ORIENTATION=+